MIKHTEQEAGGLEQVLTVVRRRWWIIVACFVVAAVASFGYSLTRHKQYTATATLLFRNPGFDQKLFGTAFVAQQLDPAREAATNLDLVGLPTVASRTARALGGKLGGGQIKRKVKIATVGQADLIAIQATDPDPALAAKSRTPTRNSTSFSARAQIVRRSPTRYSSYRATWRR